MKAPLNRISALQKDILLMLLMLEQLRGAQRTASTDLLKIINKYRDTSIYPNALRRSLHTLASSKLVNKSRNMDTLRLLFTLSQQGRDMAIGINEENEKQQREQG